MSCHVVAIGMNLHREILLGIEIFDEQREASDIARSRGAKERCRRRDHELMKGLPGQGAVANHRSTLWYFRRQVGKLP